MKLEIGNKKFRKKAYELSIKEGNSMAASRLGVSTKMIEIAVKLFKTERS